MPSPALSVGNLRLVSFVTAVALTSTACITGCGSTGAPPSDECVGSASDALRTCAKGATVSGIDISYYQGNVDFAKVKAAGRVFAFARLSDGLNFPDSKFATNWPAMKSAGLVRGAYQFFRPAQDPIEQANLFIAKMDAVGGLKPGDLPPVLDIESDGGLPSNTVVARAKTWLGKIETKYGVKPIVYTAAFMSDVIGTSFGAYPLWVANYGATCPLMPSGWTDWKFWQTSESGTVSGVAGPVDTNLFNGTLAVLQAMTLKPATPPDAGADASTDDDAPALAPDAIDVSVGGEHPNDGSEGATIGQGGTPSGAPETTSAPLTPCR